MTQAGRHRIKSTVHGRTARASRSKMNASLAMVVCFVGFQGIVPQSGESAAAVSLNQIRTSSSVSSSDDKLSPTGFVGASLLVPLGGLDALDGLDATKVRIGVWSIKSGDADAKAETAAIGGLNRPSAGTLFAPLDELTSTSSFGFRTSPITGEPGEFHTGQDYSAPCGTPVYSVDAGSVRAVGWHQWGGGNRVEVDHGNGLITSYNHLQGISVEVGDTVNGGDPIAEVGSTGSSTGCHLHFETILDGEHVDPLGWKLVPTGHGARQGELKDYTLGGSGSGEIPAWAQSSTRSDQSAPAWDALPITSGALGDTIRLPVASDASGNAGVPAGQERDEPSTPQTPTVPESKEPPREKPVSNAAAEKPEPLVRQTPPQQRVPVPPTPPVPLTKPTPAPDRTPPVPPKLPDVTPLEGSGDAAPVLTPPVPPKLPDVTPLEGSGDAAPGKTPPVPPKLPDVTPLEGSGDAAPVLTPPVPPKLPDVTPPEGSGDAAPGKTPPVPPKLPDVTPPEGSGDAAPSDPTDKPTCDTDPSVPDPSPLPEGTKLSEPAPGVQPVTPVAQPAEGGSAASPASPADGVPGSGSDSSEESDPAAAPCEDPDASVEASPGADTALAPVEGDPAAPALAQPTDGATTPARKQG